MKQFIFMLLISLTTLLHAAIIESTAEYEASSKIIIDVKDLELHEKNWIGIYPAEANNDWENVLRWTWTNEIVRGSFSFQGLPEGSYEARVFYNNSFNTEASVAFTVIDKYNSDVKIETRKNHYEENEPIQVKVENMSGHAQDWIAIYPKGSSNAWENVIDWTYTNGQIGTIIGFDGLKGGEYEVRAFFKNSYKLEASHSFSVMNQTSLTPSQTTYDISESIQIKIKGFKKGQKDWVGIYPKGSSNAWENVVNWQWVDNADDNTLTFTSLPIGEYELRGFFKNSFHVETETSFKVVKNKIVSYAKSICINGSERNNKSIGVICNYDVKNELKSIFVLDKLNYKLYSMGGFNIENFTPTLSEHSLERNREINEYTYFLGGDVTSFINRYDDGSNTVVIYNHTNKFCDFYAFSDLHKPSSKLHKVLSIDISKHHSVNSIFIAQTSSLIWTIKVDYTTGIDGYRETYESSVPILPYELKSKEEL